MTAPSKPLMRDPYQPLHDAAAAVQKGFTAENATQVVNALDWSPAAVESVAKMVKAMSDMALDNVEIDPRVAPMLAKMSEIIGRCAAPCGEVATAVRSVHREQLERIVEGQGKHTHEAWDVSRNPL